MTTARLRTLLLLATFLHAVPYAWADEKDKSKLLTRSIYVPLELKLCEHLHDAVLYQNEQAISVLPSKRIFQFTLRIWAASSRFVRTCAWKASARTARNLSGALPSRPGEFSLRTRKSGST